MSARLKNLRDAHVHVGRHGAALRAVHLADCASVEEALERVAVGASLLAPDAWVVAIGARPEGWRERRWMTAAELEAAAAGRPCVVESFDIHSVCASPAALRAAGVDRDTPEPRGGTVERGSGGEPTGLLLERARALVDRVTPRPTDEELVEHVAAAAADFAARGFVEVHDMWTDARLARAVRICEREGRLPVRVMLAPLLEDLDAALANPDFARSERVWTGAVKVFTDGTLNSRTAHMLEPYAEPLAAAPRGHALMSGDEIEAAVRRADAAGLPIAAHAIGDAAVRGVLDAVERAAPGTRGQRIEHAQFVDGADVGRFAALGVVASVQPCHLLADVEALRRLTPGRVERAFPVRELVESGATVWFGSDAPVVAPDARDNVRAAVFRRREGMGEDEAVGLGEGVEEGVALGCMKMG